MVKNDRVVQDGNTNDMLFSFKKLISYLSQYFTLKKGDLFYGTPAGVGQVNHGDIYKGYLSSKDNDIKKTNIFSLKVN